MATKQAIGSRWLFEQFSRIDNDVLRTLATSVADDAEPSVIAAQTIIGFEPDEWTILRETTERFVNETTPDQIIKRRNGPYLRRWSQGRTAEEGRRYLHHFEGSDPDDPHGHPWPSASLAIRGRMQEWWWSADEDPARDPGHLLRIEEGAIIVRSASHRHRVTVPEGETAITLFVTGPKVREWGFWTRQGEIPWQDYPE